MKKTLSFLLILWVTCSTYGQYRDIQPLHKKNSIQLELIGTGVFYSLNYERILINGERWKTAAQLGVSYYPPSTGVRDLWFPLGINEIFSLGNHHLEAGLGYMPVREALRDPDLEAREWFWSHLMTGRIGYRYQKAEGRLILRAAFTPVLEIEYLGGADAFHPLGGISVGYCF